MAYTTPRTWNVGETVTAAMMNQNVRDNVSEVFARTNTKTLVISSVTEDVLLVSNDATAIRIITIPIQLNGAKLIDAAASVYTVSSSGKPEVRIYNVSSSVNMLTKNITIDASEYTSYTAAIPRVISTANDTVTTGQRIAIFVKTAGTGTRGLDVILTFMVQS